MSECLTSPLDAKFKFFIVASFLVWVLPFSQLPCWSRLLRIALGAFLARYQQILSLTGIHVPRLPIIHVSIRALFSNDLQELLKPISINCSIALGPCRANENSKYTCVKVEVDTQVYNKFPINYILMIIFHNFIICTVLHAAGYLDTLGLKQQIVS